jgi:hypothetical protein
MADGTTKTIDHIVPGDKVIATDPQTHTTEARVVTGLWVHGDALVDLELAGGQRVTTTEDHPYWSTTRHEWQEAQQLRPGDRLLTPTGSAKRAVVGIDWATSHRGPAYNLTVADTHTYYVLAGDTPVLVHNCGTTTFYHGSGTDSVLDILNNGLDANKAAANHTDGPGGFFMATREGDAEFFAARIGSGAVIKIEISDSAMAQLIDAGAVSGPIPGGPNSPTFEGYEFHVPTSGFDLFNQLESAGEIVVRP